MTGDEVHLTYNDPELLEKDVRKHGLSWVMKYRGRDYVVRVLKTVAVITIKGNPSVDVAVRDLNVPPYPHATLRT